MTNPDGAQSVTDGGTFIYVYGGTNSFDIVHLDDFLVNKPATDAVYYQNNANMVAIVGTGHNDSISMGDHYGVLAWENSGNNTFTFGNGPLQFAHGGSGDNTFVFSKASLAGNSPFSTHTVLDFHGAGQWYTTAPHDFVWLNGFQPGAKLAYDGHIGDAQQYHVNSASGARISAEFTVVMGDHTTNHLSAGDYAFG